ncbi:MAG: mannose-6-phosphate isomerase, class I [Microbacteriaceae bacterium]|nr:mannose-6-phosphate isomerase, class I [Microbacteriaceae bacterium]
MQRLHSTPKEYSWGSPDFLPAIFGTAYTGNPQAELWFGAHPASPTAFDDGTLLSEQLKIPFLVKILSASEPLSLQVHPNKDQAKAGFERENKLGLAQDDPERNYRDDQDKPEMLVALTEFHALSGLRSLPAIIAEISEIQDASTRPLLEKLEEGYMAAFSWLLDEENDMWELVDAVSTYQKSSHSANASAGRIIAQTHPGDRGIVISYLLNALQLSPGEAIYLPAGNLHAYLHGDGVELMSPSDNVIRARFTEKHVDVAEILKIVDFEPLSEPKFSANQIFPSVSEYAPEGAPFKLFRIASDTFRDVATDADSTTTEFATSAAFGGTPDTSITLPITGQAIVLVFSGATTLEDAEGIIEASSPSAWLVKGDTVSINPSADVFIATGA